MRYFILKRTYNAEPTCDHFARRFSISFYLFLNIYLRFPTFFLFHFTALSYVGIFSLSLSLSLRVSVSVFVCFSLSLRVFLYCYYVTFLYYGKYRRAIDLVLDCRRVSLSLCLFPFFFLRTNRFNFVFHFILSPAPAMASSPLVRLPFRA